MKGMPSLKDMAVQKTKQTSVKTEDTSVMEEKTVEKEMPVILERPVEKEKPAKNTENERNMYEIYTTMVEHIFDLSDVRVIKPKREKKNSGSGRHAVCVYLNDKEYTYADRLSKKYGVSISSLLRTLLLNSK